MTCSELIAALEAADETTCYDVMLEAVRHIGANAGPKRYPPGLVGHLILDIERFKDRALFDPPRCAALLMAIPCALMPEGWTMMRSWAAANPKDRPWFGASIRKDEPYTVIQSMGGQVRACVEMAAILKTMEKDDG